MVQRISACALLFIGMQSNKALWYCGILLSYCLFHCYRCHQQTPFRHWEAVEDTVFYETPEAASCEGDIPWENKSWEPIRIKWFLAEMSNFSQSSQTVIKDLLDETVAYFGKLLSVQRSVYRIGLSRLNECIIYDGYPNHVIDKECDRQETNGIADADLVVYVQQREICGDGLLASARLCKVAASGRPTFAAISLCPDTVNTENWNRIALRDTLQHELFHGMGFHWNTLNGMIYYEEDGSWRQGNKRVIRTWKINSARKKDHEAVLVASPRVKEFVRNHFRCPDLEGAELENEGTGGTRGVHWEKRLFGVGVSVMANNGVHLFRLLQGETMTGYISRRPYVSGLTMAFFEDTGWYKANYSHVARLSFGSGAGCVFAKGSCRDYMESHSRLMSVPAAAKPYCNWADFVEKKKLKSTVRECSSDLLYYSACDWDEIRNPKDIDVDKAYFADKWAVINGRRITGRNVRGWSEVLDGCPQWIEYVYGATAHKTGDSVCTNKFSQPPAAGNWGAELFGNDSICLKQDGKFEVFKCMPLGISEYHTEEGVHGAGCYRYKCERGRLMIQANYSLEDPNPSTNMRQYKICWAKGAVILIRRHQKSGRRGKIRFHKGSIVCPDCKSLCENTDRWGKDFKCARDIQLNSTDYVDTPCPQDSATLTTKLPSFYVLITILVYLVQYIQ